MQTTNPDDMFFHQQTNTFSITLALSDNKLTITLKDFVDWAIYSKQYTEDDVGKEIHKKMDLVDVYTAFFQTKPQSDAENMKEKQNDSTKLKQYEFGTIVENKKLPCYKIEREGKMSTYLNMIDRRTGKQVLYQSKLVLTKIRSMTETETSTLKSAREKNQLLEELKKEIQNQKKEKQELFRRIISLQEQNAKLKEELRATKQNPTQRIQQLETTINEMKQEKAEDAESAKKQIYLKYDQKFQIQNKINQQQNLNLQVQNQKIEKMHQQNQNIKQQNQKIQMLQQKNQQQAEKLEQAKEELTEKLQLQTQRSLDKIAQLKSKLKMINKQIVNPQPQVKKIKTFENIHSLEQKNSNYFKVDGLKIQYTTNGWTHYLFNEPINYSQSAKFKIKIIKTQYGCIMIGVVDYAKQKDQKYSCHSGNAMIYYYDGRKWPGQETQGNGFKQGHIVQVNVDRSTSTVKYIVNGLLQATQTNNMLAGSSRVFMPYVEMCHINDTVEWLMG